MTLALNLWPEKAIGVCHLHVAWKVSLPYLMVLARIVWLVSFLEGFHIKWYFDFDVWDMDMKNRHLFLGMRSKNTKFGGLSPNCLACIVSIWFSYYIILWPWPLTMKNNRHISLIMVIIYKNSKILELKVHLAFWLQVQRNLQNEKKMSVTSKLMKIAHVLLHYIKCEWNLSSGIRNKLWTNCIYGQTDNVILVYPANFVAWV
jgi:hypothetical protein